MQKQAVQLCMAIDVPLPDRNIAVGHWALPFTPLGDVRRGHIMREEQMRETVFSSSSLQMQLNDAFLTVQLQT